MALDAQFLDTGMTFVLAVFTTIPKASVTEIGSFVSVDAWKSSVNPPGKICQGFQSVK